jgi:hypothetical protein
LSGIKSSPNLSKAPTPQKASPGTTIPGLSPIENLNSFELAHSPNTTPPSPRCHGLGSTGEGPIGGDLAQPQLESIPGQTPLVVENLANDLDFIKAEFHISRFITTVVDTEADHINTEALQTELDSASTRIYVSNPWIIVVHYRHRSILTSSRN